MIIIGIMLVSSGILHHSMQSLTESILLDVLRPMAGKSAKTVEQAIIMTTGLAGGLHCGYKPLFPACL